MYGHAVMRCLGGPEKVIITEHINTLPKSLQKANRQLYNKSNQQTIGYCGRIVSRPHRYISQK